MIRSASCTLLIALCLPSALSAQRYTGAKRPVDNSKVSVRQLPPVYRHWLEEEVTYIINEDEKQQFLQLHSDAEREKFIQAFWAARNPDPGSDINTYKEEHYRRLQYVNEHFGDERYHDGWRTDMGRVYITLGPPKQTAIHHQGRRVRPVEIWFYESPSPALQPYFNLVFYKRSESEGYTLYSPREDGPERIITDQARSPADALHIIDQAFGAEATHSMVSLIPGEPIDIDNPQPTMSSDLLLAKIRDLADQPLEKERIAALRTHEKVSSSLLFAQQGAQIDTAVFRDSEGQPTVNFLLRNEDMNPSVLGPLGANRTGYHLTLSTRVITTDGRAVYQQQDPLESEVSASAVETAREKHFAVEGRLPLSSGSYDVEATLVNERNHQVTTAHKRINVPAPSSSDLAMSDLIAYRQPAPIQDRAGQLPFAVTGLRFTPRGVQNVILTAGERLPLVYQVWFPSQDLATQGSIAKKLHAHYVVGTLAVTGTPVQEDEDIDVHNLDAAGNLLTGHTIDTTGLAPGRYRVVVRLTEPGTPRSISSTMNLQIMPADKATAMWSAYADESRHPLWQSELLRGIAAEANANPTEAALCYKHALQLNPDATEAKTRLEGLSKKLETAKKNQTAPTR